MRKILLKLGLIKMNRAEFNKNLTYLFEFISKTVTDERNLGEEKSKLTKCEIKILLWVYAAQIFNNKLDSNLCDSIMKFIWHEIIFSSINISEYEDDFIQNLVNERDVFYKEMLTRDEYNLRYDNSTYYLSILWFEEPFQSIAEIKNSKVIHFGLNPYEKFNAQASISAFFTQLLPGYIKEVESLIRNLNK
jgi:hypothetical protein